MVFFNPRKATGGGIVAKTVRPEISMVKVLRNKFVAKNGKLLF